MLVRKLTLALLAGSALSFAGAAYAADAYTPPPEPVYEPAPEAWSWTGIHFGVGGGGNFNFADVYSEGYDYDWNNDYFFQNLTSNKLGTIDWFGTVEGGFDWQVGSMVIGIAGNFDWSGGSTGWDSSYQDDSDGFCYLSDFGCSYTYKDHSIRFGNSWAVTGRLGFLVNPQTLLYGLAGYTQAQITATGFYDVDNDYSTSISLGGWRPGWTVGAGLEAMLTKNLSAKVEYRFASYAGFSGSVGPGIPYYQYLEVDNPVTHSIRGVLSWRWGM